jgi:hypothetical protein
MRDGRTVYSKVWIGGPVRLAVVAMMAGVMVGGAAEVPAERKYYVGKSPAACETIDYACPSGWKSFHDAQGCGCILPPPEGKQEGGG